MYKINTIAGKAAKENGFASYPEDFPHLKNGENFVAFQVGNDWEIETVLCGKELQEELRIFAKKLERDET